MTIRYCKNCGKMMVFEKASDTRTFCGPKCRKENLEGSAPVENIGPDMPPLDKDAISEDGYIALVAGIVGQASDDVRRLAPGTAYRADAEEFFLSDYFYDLTGFDGFDLLVKLQDEYDEKKQRKGT